MIPKPMLAGVLILMTGGLALAHPPAFHRADLVELDPPQETLDFSLQTLAGETVRMADFRGRYLLLNFWATWCPPCVKEMPSMQKLADTLSGEPFVVLAVSQDTEGAAKVRPFVARLGVTFPIALDPDNKVGDAYGAYDLPTTFLIDPQGRMIAVAKGDRDWAAPETVFFLREMIGRRP